MSLNWKLAIINSMYFALIENSYEKIKQKSSNKRCHSIFGNKQQKNVKYIKVMELNKRNSNFNTNIELLKHLVNRESPDICFFTESNSVKEYNLASSFKDYEIFHKPENNHP